MISISRKGGKTESNKHIFQPSSRLPGKKNKINGKQESR